MAKRTAQADLQVIPRLSRETLYVGVDIGKKTHVAGFVSTTLLSRHQRFEHCPALSFENSREGFRSLVDRISSSVPLTQVYVVMEVTGHYHRPLLHYLQELDLPVYVMHVQKRQEGVLKTDKRDALGLGNLLFNQLEKGIQVGDPMQAVRGKNRLLSDAKLLELQRLAAQSIGTKDPARLRGLIFEQAQLIEELE